MLKLVKKKPKQPVTLKEHYVRRNKILIKRRCGGFGDILMTRMMFEDMKNDYPEMDFYFSCPHHFLEFAKNNPYNTVIPLEEAKEKDYGITYDITTACRVHEMRQKQNNRDHRSDIWAKCCGINLKNHNAHLQCEEHLKKECVEAFKMLNPENKPIVLFTPYSSSEEIGVSKSLTNEQITEVTEKLKDDYFVYTIHNEKKAIFDATGIHQFVQINHKLWIALVAASDYVISVDTATFHIAGCLGVPLVGIFAFTNGKVYGKYYDFTLVQKELDCGPCFYLHTCPKSKEFPKPCLTELTAQEIIQGFNRLSSSLPELRTNQEKKGLSFQQE